MYSLRTRDVVIRNPALDGRRKILYVSRQQPKSRMVAGNGTSERNFHLSDKATLPELSATRRPDLLKLSDLGSISFLVSYRRGGVTVPW